MQEAIDSNLLDQKATFTFFGTGGSLGVPVVGCSCAVCLSTHPYNKRYRASGILTWNNQHFLIDCGPDFRTQALNYKLKDLTAVLFTHAHYDHIAALDELRVFSIRHHKPLPCLLSTVTADELKMRFSYIFEKEAPSPTLLANIELQLLKQLRGSIAFEGLLIRYMTYEQGGTLVTGYRCGNFAYISDIKKYPESIFEDLKGVEVLVLSALRFTQSSLHFSIDEAIVFANRVGAAQTWLTHTAHDLDYEKTNAYLPDKIRMAYDNLELKFKPEISV